MTSMSQLNSYEQEVPENTKLCKFYIIRIKQIHKYINNDQHSSDILSVIISHFNKVCIKIISENCIATQVRVYQIFAHIFLRYVA